MLLLTITALILTAWAILRLALKPKPMATSYKQFPKVYPKDFPQLRV